MDRSQLIGHYARLESELIEAYTAPSCQPGMIERITDDLAAIRRRLRHGSHVDDEQTSDHSVPGVLEFDLTLD